jgi:hypothetical protein
MIFILQKLAGYPELELGGLQCGEGLFGETIEQMRYREQSQLTSPAMIWMQNVQRKVARRCQFKGAILRIMG